jgi:hypothetical protein
VTDAVPQQPHPEDTDNGQATYADSFVRRKISVKGTGGVAATVTVIAQRGQVWVSIQPLFTWEAIMEPGKVDELLRTLTLAREDAKKMESKNRVTRGNKQQPVGTVTVLPGNKALRTDQARP